MDDTLQTYVQDETLQLAALNLEAVNFMTRAMYSSLWRSGTERYTFLYSS